jgi:hypothetical protein
MEFEKLYTVKELSELLKIKERYVRLIPQDALPKTKLPGIKGLRYRHSDVERYLGEWKVK